MNTINSSHPSLSLKAQNKLLQLQNFAGSKIPKLRVYIKGGGCSGFQYLFKLETSFKPTDQIFGNLVVDTLSLQFLAGALIEYEENLYGSRFFVINPNAKTTCGCGASFSI